MGQNQCYHFGAGAPPILEPILVGIGMFTGGTIWILTHGQFNLGRLHHGLFDDGHLWASDELRRPRWTKRAGGTPRRKIWDGFFWGWHLFLVGLKGHQKEAIHFGGCAVVKIHAPPPSLPSTKSYDLRRQSGLCVRRQNGALWPTLVRWIWAM